MIKCLYPRLQKHARLHLSNLPVASRNQMIESKYYRYNSNLIIFYFSVEKIMNKWIRERSVLKQHPHRCWKCNFEIYIIINADSSQQELKTQERNYKSTRLSFLFQAALQRLLIISFPYIVSSLRVGIWRTQKLFSPNSSGFPHCHQRSNFTKGSSYNCLFY